MCKVPPICQRSWDAERRGWRRIAEGRGAGGGWGIQRRQRPGVWEGPEKRQAACLATTCPDQTGFILHLGRSWLAFSRFAAVGLRWLACTSSAPGVWGPQRRPHPPAAPGVRPGARSWGAGDINGEQERAGPLFPPVLQPSGWSPQFTELPGLWVHADHAGGPASLLLAVATGLLLTVGASPYAALATV